MCKSLNKYELDMICENFLENAVYGKDLFPSWEIHQA